MTVVAMSRSELSRYETLQRVERGEITASEAGELLRLCRRQVYRLLDRFRADGAAGLISRKRGRPSNRRLSETYREQILGVVRERYADFGPTLAAEYLAERHGITLSHETLRQLMISAGLWKAKAAKRARLHQTRNRRERRGELIQVDGSDHDWFEGRGPRCSLLVYIDDATSELMHLEMAESESALSYLQATRTYLERHGKPIAFYSDKHSAFRNNRATADGDGMSHLGRALDKLGVEIICANSPQAKGRVERANSTLQNRLVKAMRLEGISSIEEANTFLPSYLLRHNAQFACPPADPRDAHRPLAAHENVEAEMVWRVERSVTGALALHYNKAMFILEPTPLARTLARKRVHVCEFPDGRIEVRHGEVVLPYRVYDKMQRVNQAEIVENKRLGAALAMAQALQSANPHHRQRNNNAPARSSQSVGVFATPRVVLDDGRLGNEPSKRRGRPPLPRVKRQLDTAAGEKQTVR
ncbi:ISNCY family transposase [Sphingomonas parapaucimobilis]|uniref:Putative transposase n=1 Tax=Sphingomonas parapaucimobilis NBRC 15100 TaxID=1219049 RepID=A0A0A1W962_9SPHN|nr:ISNCY family transposase [Sphingomonas parapaucimobilis]GAM01848.1 putative transposase [Sphingomonas parapaucimobilis NBRC 15100]